MSRRPRDPSARDQTAELERRVRALEMRKLPPSGGTGPTDPVWAVWGPSRANLNFVQPFAGLFQIPLDGAAGDVQSSGSGYGSVIGSSPGWTRVKVNSSDRAPTLLKPPEAGFYQFGMTIPQIRASESDGREIFADVYTATSGGEVYSEYPAKATYNTSGGAQYPSLSATGFSYIDPGASGYSNPAMIGSNVNLPTASSAAYGPSSAAAVIPLLWAVKAGGNTGGGSGSGSGTDNDDAKFLFRTFPAASQTLGGDNLNHAINFNAVDSDPHGVIDTTHGWWVAPETGVYFFLASLGPLNTFSNEVYAWMDITPFGGQRAGWSGAYFGNKDSDVFGTPPIPDKVMQTSGVAFCEAGDIVAARFASSAACGISGGQLVGWQISTFNYFA